MKAGQVQIGPSYAPGEKNHRDENFPVASYMISRRYRAAVLAFYRFARAADDVADHPDLSERDKIAQLELFEATLLGRSDAIAAALPLRADIAAHGLTARHGLDLLVAFRQDAMKPRYADWGELMGYCAYSAAPVGRFVLDLHGESQALWPASDALCAALQIINHLQDCKADYLRLNRIYIPHDALARHGLAETALAAPQAVPSLRACIRDMAEKTQDLMGQARFSLRVQDLRLAVEVGAIERLADRLLRLLILRDPLSERVHLGKIQLLSAMGSAAMAVLAGKMLPAPPDIP